MKIITVIPITGRLYSDTLSYFSLQDIENGTLVYVTIRNKLTPAIVVDSQDASELKAIIRGSDFAMKRLQENTKRHILSPPAIEAIIYTADYNAGSVGGILHAMLPKKMLSVENIKIHYDTENTFEEFALQTSPKDIISIYKNMSREILAKKQSIIIVTPFVHKAVDLHKQLSAGIKDRVFLFTSKTTKKQFNENYTALSTGLSGSIIITTPSFALIPINNIGMIVLDEYSSNSYTTIKKPIFDRSILIEHYAKELGTKLVYSDPVLPNKIYMRLERNEIIELTPLSTRERTHTNVNILDMKNSADKNKKSNVKKQFEPLSAEVLNKIKETLNEGGKVFVLTPRKGLAPVTICGDCKNILSCHVCSTPMTLHKVGNSTEYLCNKCGATRDSNTVCDVCTSWNLQTLGIGIELVERELKKHFKKTKILRLDSKVAKTKKQTEQVVQQFEASSSVILVGTQKAVPYINNADLSIVASIDSMLTIPDFNIDEKVFFLLSKVIRHTKHEVIIQTRMPDRHVLKYVKNGNISGFMREELELRKVLKYPPYTTMIYISTSGSKAQIINNFQTIMPELEPYKPRIFKQFIMLSPGKYTLRALLRLPQNKWPDKKLVKLLKKIQPPFNVTVT